MNIVFIGYMKKTVIVHLTSSLKVGGAESLLCDIARHLAKNTLIEQYVMYFHEGPNIEVIQKLGIKTYHIKGFFFRYDLFFFVRLFYQFIKLQPTCIHASLWFANAVGSVFAIMFRIPQISTIHLAANADKNIKMSKFRAIIDRLTLRLADQIVTVSLSTKETLCAEYPWLSKKNIKVITNGIDIENVQEQAKNQSIVRLQLGLADEHFVIGCVGRFIPRKNHGLLLEVCALLLQHHPQVHLLLIGQGPLEEQLKQQARVLGIETHVHFVQANQAYGYYNIMDCFILPSEQEGLSIALLEAMSLKVPCIVTSTAKRHDVIQTGKHGLIVPAYRQDIAEAVKMLVQDHHVRELLASQGYEHVCASFNISLMVTQYEQLYKDLCRTPN